jgi:hypothetical protein
MSFRPRLVAFLVLFWVLWRPGASAAQLQVHPASLELGGGLALAGVIDLGAVDATMTNNQPRTPERFKFFRVDSRINAVPAPAVWVAVNVTRAVGFEVGFQRSRPTIRTKVSGDAEGVPPVTLTTESISQRIIEGNVIFHANAGRFDGQRTVPFLLAGGGYLRQVDDDQAQTETGRLYQVGFGFKWVSGITQSGRARGPGMRLDLRYVIRDAGFDVRDDTRRSFVTAGITAFVAF